MSLYNIPPPVSHGNHLDYTDRERRCICMDVRGKFRIYQGSMNIVPTFYVSTTVFLLLMDSEDFKLYNTQKDSNKVGSYDGGTVYLSKHLDPLEYYIGIENHEILHIKRKLKLDKITRRMKHVL